MAANTKLLETVADIIADYRDGEISRPDANHVDLWLAQFTAGYSRVPLVWPAHRGHPRAFVCDCSYGRTAAESGGSATITPRRFRRSLYG
jgi:hypothetical protein